MLSKSQPSQNWFTRPFIIFFLPYFYQAAAVNVHPDLVQGRFIALHNKSILNDISGVISLTRKRYNITADNNAINIYGPYGYRAWTMYSQVSVIPDGDKSILEVKACPHRSVVLNLLFALAVLCTGAIVMQFSFAPFFPLVVFGPFLYVAAVVATKVESAKIENIVLQVANDDGVKVSY